MIPALGMVILPQNLSTGNGQIPGRSCILSVDGTYCTAMLPLKHGVYDRYLHQNTVLVTFFLTRIRIRAEYTGLVPLREAVLLRCEIPVIAKSTLSQRYQR